MPVSIPNTTLVCVDCVDVPRAVASLERSLQQCSFDQVLLLTSLPCDYENSATILPLRSRVDYSSFVVYELASYIETDYALIVQHDGWIVNGTKWDNAWLGFDYIGGNAAWTEPGDEGKGGNGGFSLRSRRLLEAAPSLVNPILGCHYEDLFFSAIGRSKIRQRAAFESLGFAFAPRILQQRFALDRQLYSGQFGHHQCRFLT